jgi:transcriptional regulator with XRE-family HTH domain
VRIRHRGKTLGSVRHGKGAKGQKLTQRRLGQLAGVSTPTVSRFENGAKDIQLSTVTSILGALGMLDDRTLVFPDTPARYDSVRDVAVLEGRDGDRTVRCGISREALEDHFGGDDRNLLKGFRTHRERIEHEARRKYLGGRVEPDGSILVKTDDL